jgi:hypothetical protein
VNWPVGIQGWEFTGKGNAQVTQIAGEKSLEADLCPQPEAPLAMPILDNSIWLTKPSAERKDEAIARARAKRQALMLMGASCIVTISMIAIACVFLPRLFR